MKGKSALPLRHLALGGALLGADVSPEDPALIVPNIYGFGWTINMANPMGKIIAAATIAVLVITTLVFVYFG